MAIAAERNSRTLMSTPTPVVEGLPRSHSAGSKYGNPRSSSRRRRRGNVSGTRARVEALAEDLANAALDSRVSGQQQRQQESGVATATAFSIGPFLPLGDLPPDILHRLLQMLPVSSLMHLGQTSRRMLSLLTNDILVWRAICQRDFGAHTSPEEWLLSCGSPLLTRQRSSGSLPSDEADPPLRATTYRSLYRILKHNQRLVGTWRGLGCGPEGALFLFRWARGCVEGLRVCGSPAEPWAALLPFHTLGGVCPGAVASFDSERMCTVRELPPAPADSMSPIPCSKATAAALVAESSGVQVMGSSPEGSWGHEVMLFMQGTVAPTRRKKKSPARQLRDAMPVLHHLSYLSIPEPTAAEPLSGLWQAHLQQGGVQVVCVEYLRPRSPSASILATKVTGDDRVGCGQVLWEAKASMVSEPWDEAELHLIEGVAHNNEVANPTRGIARAPDVLAVHSAECAAAQFNGGRGKCSGRLWHYENGNLGLCWMLPTILEYMQFSRLDSVLVSGEPS